MKLFLDANVLFSASNRGSAIDRLIRRAASEEHELIASGYVVDEARLNLLAAFPERIDALDQHLERMVIVSTAAFRLPVELARKDVPVLCSTILSGCTHLVTGDRRDFGHLFDRTVHGVAVINPRRLAELL